MPLRLLAPPRRLAPRLPPLPPRLCLPPRIFGWHCLRRRWLLGLPLTSPPRRWCDRGSHSACSAGPTAARLHTQQGQAVAQRRQQRMSTVVRTASRSTSQCSSQCCRQRHGHITPPSLSCFLAARPHFQGAVVTAGDHALPSSVKGHLPDRGGVACGAYGAWREGQPGTASSGAKRKARQRSCQRLVLLQQRLAVLAAARARVFRRVEEPGMERGA